MCRYNSSISQNRMTRRAAALSRASTSSFTSRRLVSSTGSAAGAVAAGAVAAGAVAAGAVVTGGLRAGRGLVLRVFGFIGVPYAARRPRLTVLVVLLTPRPSI